MVMNENIPYHILLEYPNFSHLAVKVYWMPKRKQYCFHLTVCCSFSEQLLWCLYEQAYWVIRRSLESVWLLLQRALKI